MDREDRNLGTYEHGDDVAAYLLGALEPSEAEAFELHLESCGSCRDELAALRGIPDQLAISPHQHRVPARVRKRVLGSIRAEPRATGEDARRRPVFGSLRPALVAVAAVVLIAVILGVIALGSGGSSGARLYRASVLGSPGSAQLQVSSGHGELIVRGLPQPASGRIYEVWLKRPGSAPAPTPALFSVTSAGAGVVGVPGDLAGVSEILVTQEPDGGSLVPTTPPVIVARLT